jgi:hypothetical protein
MNSNKQKRSSSFPYLIQFNRSALSQARMRVPKMAKNGYNSVFRVWANP